MLEHKQHEEADGVLDHEDEQEDGEAGLEGEVEGDARVGLRPISVSSGKEVRSIGLRSEQPRSVAKSWMNLSLKIAAANRMTQNTSTPHHA